MASRGDDQLARRSGNGPIVINLAVEGCRLARGVDSAAIAGHAESSGDHRRTRREQQGAAIERRIERASGQSRRRKGHAGIARLRVDRVRAARVRRRTAVASAHGHDVDGVANRTTASKAAGQWGGRALRPSAIGREAGEIQIAREGFDAELRGPAGQQTNLCDVVQVDVGRRSHRHRRARHGVIRQGRVVQNVTDRAAAERHGGGQGQVGAKSKRCARGDRRAGRERQARRQGDRAAKRQGADAKRDRARRRPGRRQADSGRQGDVAAAVDGVIHAGDEIGRQDRAAREGRARGEAGADG